jgi:hypothetical protein
VQVNPETNSACIYHILLHFEPPIREYFSNEIIEMTNACFQKIGIDLGDILEPIAPLCRAKEPKAWNGSSQRSRNQWKHVAQWS